MNYRNQMRMIKMLTAAAAETIRVRVDKTTLMEKFAVFLFLVNIAV